MISLNLAPEVARQETSLKSLLSFGLISIALLVLVPSVCIRLYEGRFPSQAELDQTGLEAKRRAGDLRNRIQEAQSSFSTALQERALRINHRDYTEMLQGLLSVLPEIIPEEVFMISLSAEASRLIIEGGARDATVLAQFVEGLKEAYGFMVFDVEEVRRVVKEQSMVDSFRISGKLRDTVYAKEH